MWTVIVAGQDKSQYGSQGERMIVANMSRRQADQLPDRIQNHSYSNVVFHLTTTHPSRQCSAPIKGTVLSRSDTSSSNGV
jgi:hypothetical protein